MDMLPANLPSVGNARLPEVYANAKTALQACVTLDECKTWADKAEAMASYAKQANDPEMRQMADRIQARAIRRCGVLLKGIEPAHGANQNIQDGGVPKVTRENAAEDAGLSERQRKTALRVANVPEPDFETAIEGDNPATVTALAEQGTVKKPIVDLGTRTPEEFAAGTKLIGLLAYIERIGVPIDVAFAVRGLSATDRTELLSQIAHTEDWLHLVTVELRNACQPVSAT